MVSVIYRGAKLGLFTIYELRFTIWFDGELCLGLLLAKSGCMAVNLTTEGAEKARRARRGWPAYLSEGAPPEPAMFPVFSINS